MNANLKRSITIRWYSLAQRELIALTFSLCLGAVHAVTCQNNLLPSNPDFSYSVHNNGTVTDNRTKRMWKVCAEGQTWSAGACTGTAGVITWVQAIALSEVGSFAGYSDWRLPNVRELRSLIEECRTSPSINESIFPLTASSSFWSSSPYVGMANRAWTVSFSSGEATPYGNTALDYGGLFVRLVRAGQ